MKNLYFKAFKQFFTANFIVRFISLIREMVLAWYVGPSRILDIFFFITTIPNLVNATWNKSIETILLTKYEKFVSEKDVHEARIVLFKYISNLIGISFFIYLILSISFPFIIYFFYNNIFSPIFIKSVFLINIAFIIETYIIAIKVVKFSEQNFFLPTIIPLFQSLVMILGIIILKNKITVLYLSVLYSFGSIIQLSILFKNEFAVFRNVFKSKFEFSSVKLIFKDSMFLSLAAGISSLNLFVDQSFALSLGESANSYIHYGNYFLLVYSFLFVKNINTIFFPQFQKFVLKNEHDLLAKDATKIIKFIMIINIPIIVIILNNGYVILKIVLEHGRVNEYDIRNIYFCTLGYGGAFLGTAINAILIRILHVYSEYKFILKISLINFSFNIILNYILVKLFGVWGLALSTSVTILFVVSIYFIYLKKRRNILFFKDKNWYKNYLKILLILIVFEGIIGVYFKTFLISQYTTNILIFIISIVGIIITFSIFKIIDIKNFRINLG